MRRVWPLVALVALSLTASWRVHAQADEPTASASSQTTAPPPRAARNLEEETPTTAEPAATLVKEDANFDPYDENIHVYRPSASAREPLDEPTYQPKKRKVELFDFDPSEGLTFHVFSNKKECFFQDAKFTGDEISGAYVVSSADSHIDLEIKNPAGVVVYRRFGDAEGQYQVRPTEEGVHELCFINSDSDGKLVTHVTNTLKSQHPVEREHVSVVAKYASHLDVRLGELESEQRLQQIRTDRFIKIEESTSQRVAFYGTLECFVYFLICLYQVLYIKGLLDGPRQALPTRKTWA